MAAPLPEGMKVPQIEWQPLGVAAEMLTWTEKAAAPAGDSLG